MSNPDKNQKFDVLPYLIVMIIASAVGAFLGSFIAKQSIQPQIDIIAENLRKQSAMAIKVIDVASISDANSSADQTSVATKIKSVSESLAKEGNVVFLSTQVYRWPASTAVTSIPQK